MLHHFVQFFQMLLAKKYINKGVEYEDKIVSRPFAVVGGVTYYGNVIEKSMYDVAKAIKNDGFRGLTAAQQFIDCAIDKDEFVLPMLPPGGSMDDIIVRIGD